MNPRRNMIVVIAGAVVLLVVALMLRPGQRPSAPGMAVVFVGMTNNAQEQMTPTRVAVFQGVVGLEVLFFVQNVTSNRYLWFKQTAIEQKTASGWQLFSTNVPFGPSLEGLRWTPGYGCLYAAGWPAGLPTNTIWRMRVIYGHDPDKFGVMMNQRLGFQLFDNSGLEGEVLSTEVRW